MKASEVKEVGYYWWHSGHLLDGPEWSVVHITFEDPDTWVISTPGSEVPSYLFEDNGEYFGPLTPPGKP